MKNRLPIILCFITVAGIDCREKYTPPVFKTVTNFLVVEGFINVGQDTTRITLSRTSNIGDSTNALPEHGANVAVKSENGSVYNLKEDSNGTYSIPFINGDITQKYRVEVNTTDGRQYASDFVENKQTPPIDSISWEYKPEGVHIYANAHDDKGATKYYKWDYIETWEYHAPYDSYCDFVNGFVVSRDLDKHIYKCWRTIKSSNILLASTTKLSADVVYRSQVMFIPVSTQRLGIKYSILLKQYALTKGGFDYWQQLSKNTEKIGSLFDPQPSQLTGNIHCLSNPGEAVIGFVTASTMQQKRAFISRDDIDYWYYPPAHTGCDTIHLDSHEKELFYLTQGYIAIDHYSRDYIYATTYECADCRAQGGTLIKPSFWP